MDAISSFRNLRLIHVRGEDCQAYAPAIAAVDFARTADWVDDRIDLEGLHLVMASVNAHIAGFAAARANGALIEIGRVGVSPVLFSQQDEVLSAMVEGVLDCASRPWADVRVASDSPALVHLLRTGWQPTPAARPQRPSRTLTLTGAGVE